MKPVEVGAWRVRVVDEAHDFEGLRVDEEDRHRVLSAPPVIPDGPSEHPIQIMTALWDFEPSPLGTIIERSERLWLAVVHDLDASPTLDRSVAEGTLRAVLDAAQARGHPRLALSPWGVRHGPWTLADSLDMLLSVLQERWRPPLRDLDLRVSSALTSDTHHYLQRLGTVGG